MGKQRTLRNAGVTLRISITWRGISEKLLLIRIETVGYILLLRWITILVSIVHILSKFVRYLPIRIHQSQIFPLSIQFEVSVITAVIILIWKIFRVINLFNTRGIDNQVAIGFQRHIGKRPLGQFTVFIRQVPTFQIYRFLTGIINLNPVRKDFFTFDIS
ncbi:hypothetical protein ES703_100436 [subsurface metagenome]